MLTTNSSVFATRADVIARPAEVADKTDKQWLMLAVLLLGQFMGLLDVFVVNVALPTIGADLDACGASLQLVGGEYAVAYATAVMVPQIMSVIQTQFNGRHALPRSPLTGWCWRVGPSSASASAACW